MKIKFRRDLWFFLVGVCSCVATSTIQGAEGSGPASLRGVAQANLNFDSSRLIVRTRTGELGLFDVKKKTRIPGDAALKKPANSYILSPDTRKFLVDFKGGKGRVFDTSSGAAVSPILDLSLREEAKPKALFSPDGATILYFGEKESSVLDVKTGKRLWIFKTIPSPGEFGNETWLKDSWSYTGNTGAWGQISVDPELQIAYLPVESATGDYFGADRPGNNLFAESLVAVDLQTGKRKWHYQLVHHGIWDHDIPCAPILVDIKRDGKVIKAVAQPTKQAFMYVFDRVTGQPLWPIEERPVPKGDVPGEYYSPTQPFPLNGRGQPFNYDRQGFVADDLIDFTPELRAEGAKVVSRYKIGPVFTPPVVSKAEGPLATLVLASAGGGTNWPGGSYDPETNILYVNSQKSVSQLGLVPPRDPSKNDLAYVMGNALTGARTTGGTGSAAGGDRAVAPGTTAAAAAAAPAGEGGGGASITVQGLPIMKPPYGQLTAIDLGKGEILWQVPHGETPEAIKNHPLLKGLNIPRTGRPGVVGSMTTKTLVVSGEAGFGPTTTGARGAMLRAYDKATGKEVGAVYIPAPQTGSPMTYMLNGRQYIVVAVSGAGYSGELIAFRLPS